jgi:hypothetical protein
VEEEEEEEEEGWERWTLFLRYVTRSKRGKERVREPGFVESMANVAATLHTCEGLDILPRRRLAYLKKSVSNSIDGNRNRVFFFGCVLIFPGAAVLTSTIIPQ